MEKPAEYNITIYKDRDYSQTFEFCQDDGVTAVDLTGYTVESEIRDAGKELIIAFSVAVVEEEGKVTLSLTDTQTGTITAAQGVYDILFTDPVDFDETWVLGKVEFLSVVTQKSEGE